MGTATITGSVVYPVSSGGSNGTLLIGSPEIVLASSPLTLVFDEKFSNTFKVPTGAPTLISFGTIASGDLVYVGTDQPLDVILSGGSDTFSLAAGGFIIMHLADVTALSVEATLLAATVEVLVLGS